MYRLAFVSLVVALFCTTSAVAQELKPNKEDALLKIIVENSAGFPVDGTIVSVSDDQGKRLFSKVSDSKGILELLVPKGKTYAIMFTSFGVETKETVKKIPVPDKENFKFTIKMTYNPVFVATFTLDGVYFDTGKSKLKPESYPNMVDLIDYMKLKPTTEIELSGHTDDKGDDKKNLELSQKRAESVKAYLVTKGIAANRIVAVGFGETKPIAPNNSAAGRKRNRRTEVKITKT